MPQGVVAEEVSELQVRGTEVDTLAAGRLLPLLLLRPAEQAREFLPVHRDQLSDRGHLRLPGALHELVRRAVVPAMSQDYVRAGPPARPVSRTAFRSPEQRHRRTASASRSRESSLSQVVDKVNGQTASPAVPPPGWGGTLTARVRRQFDLLELGRRYSIKANQTLRGIHHHLVRQLKCGGRAAVRTHMTDMAASHLVADPNSWTGVAYRTWGANDDFCEGRFW